MSQLNTELATALLNHESLDEFFLAHLEEAMNNLLKSELTGFLGYEKHSFQGYGSGNSRNGYYQRELDTRYGKLHLLIPRDRQGRFDQQLIPDYALFQTESAANYEKILASIKARGVKQALLFASDGLEGMRDAVKRQFPEAEHQQCWAHLSRTVARYIRNKDRKTVLGDLKKVYPSGSAGEAEKALQEFLNKHAGRYPRLTGIFERAKESLYSFYRFPEAIRQALYTTNLIERSNKGLKHKSRLKEQFPNEDALERFVCCHYSDLNRTYAERVQRGFMKVSAEILEMFEQQAQESAA